MLMFRTYAITDLISLLCFLSCPLPVPLCSLVAPGVFLICWLPFFVTHILNTHCRTCYVPPGLYSAFTWLGYVNSALNPVIYTTFNIEFRRAFIKILSCWGRLCQIRLELSLLRLCCGVFGAEWPQELVTVNIQEFCVSSRVKQEETQKLWYAINANKREFIFTKRLLNSTTPQIRVFTHVVLLIAHGVGLWISCTVYVLLTGTVQ